MNFIMQGENFIVIFDLKNSDNTPLALASLSAAKVDLLSNDVLIDSYEYPGDNLRANSVLTQLELEVTGATTSKFKKGDVVLRLTLKRGNISYKTENEIDVILIKEVSVI